MMLFLTLEGQWQVKDTVFKMVTLMRRHDDVGLLVMSLLYNSPVSYFKPFHTFLTSFSDVVWYYPTIL